MCWSWFVLYCLQNAYSGNDYQQTFPRLGQFYVPSQTYVLEANIALLLDDYLSLLDKH